LAAYSRMRYTFSCSASASWTHTQVRESSCNYRVLENCTELLEGPAGHVCEKSSHAEAVGHQHLKQAILTNVEARPVQLEVLCSLERIQS
jgi:hypothetical protein